VVDLKKELSFSDLIPKLPAKKPKPVSAAATKRRPMPPEVVGLKIEAAGITAAHVVNNGSRRLVQLVRTPLEAIVAQTLVKKKGGGRVAACEVLVGAPAFRNLIRESKLHQIPSMMQTGQRLGMQTLDMALQDLVKRGLVDASALPPRPAGLNGGTQPGAAAPA